MTRYKKKNRKIIYERVYRENHREEIKRNQRAYRESHKESIKIKNIIAYEIYRYKIKAVEEACQDHLLYGRGFIKHLLA